MNKATAEKLGRRRAGGRRAKLRGKGSAIRQLPWTRPVNLDRPTEPLDEESVAANHDGAWRHGAQQSDFHQIG